MRRISLVSLVALTVVASMIGCSGKESSDNGDASGSGSDTGTSDAPTTGPSGTYKGYIESYKFPDGSDTVSMNLIVNGDGSVTGTLTFGDVAPLGPPTDPDATYPPGFGEPGSVPNNPVEGFAFTVMSGTLAGSRVTLQVQEYEVWKAWCELQTKIYPQYNGESDGSCGPLIGYGCLPNVATMDIPSGCAWTSCEVKTPTAIDCGKRALCGGGFQVCHCTATACTANIGPAGMTIAFDMQLSGGALNGSVVGINAGGPPLDVHLTRE
jgi:hypothetical protein